MRRRVVMHLCWFTALLFIGAALAAETAAAAATKAAEKRKVEIKPKAALSGEHRIALVIGNGGYRTGGLRNSVNDARAVAAALRELDFEVDERINLGYQDMGRAINRFGQAIRTALSC